MKASERLTAVYSLVTFFAVIGLICFARNRELVHDIELFATNDLALAWLLMLSLYVFRAFIPFLPSYAFYAMSGRIFLGKFVPFLVSFSGTVVLHALSYLLGLIRRRKRVHKKGQIYFLRESFFQRAMRLIGDGSFHKILILALSPFPIKTLGKICGRMKLNFVRFLSASVLGSLPGMISATLLGKSLSDPTSPLFLVSLFITVVFTVLSLILFQKTNSEENVYHEKSN